MISKSLAELAVQPAEDPKKIHTDTPYRQDPNLGEDKGGLLVPKKDKYEVYVLYLLTHKIFGSSVGWTANSTRLLDIKTEVGA